MKKVNIILVILAIFFGVYTMQAAESNSPSNNEANTEISASYEFIQSVTAHKFTKKGSITIKTSATVSLYKSDSVYYVKRNGEYYRVRSSDRSGYDYMFYEGSGAWYFNY